MVGCYYEAYKEYSGEIQKIGRHEISHQRHNQKIWKNYEVKTLGCRQNKKPVNFSKIFSWELMEVWN